MAEYIQTETMKTESIQVVPVIKAPPIQIVEELVYWMNRLYNNEILTSLAYEKQIEVISDIMVYLAINKYSPEEGEIDFHYDYRTALDGSWNSWLDTDPREEVFTRFLEIYQ